MKIVLVLLITVFGAVSAMDNSDSASEELPHKETRVRRLKSSIDNKDRDFDMKACYAGVRARGKPAAFWCSVCKYVACRQALCERHIRCHHNTTITAHIIKCHKGKIEKLWVSELGTCYKCLLCDAVFRAEIAYKEHAATATHQQKLKDNPDLASAVHMYNEMPLVITNPPPELPYAWNATANNPDN